MRPLLDILAIDDNPMDILIMREALDGSRRTKLLHAASDGAEALAFLRRERPFENAPRPDLILLDLNMPGMGGFEVLSKIKSDPALCSIPTVMLTSSDSEHDVERAYEERANGYVQKPTDLDDFIAILGGIETFWSGIATLPSPA